MLKPRNRLVVLLLCAAVLLAGCVRVDMAMTIRDDTSIEFNVDYSVPKSREFRGEKLTKDNVCMFVSQQLQIPGSKANAYEQGDIVGCRASIRHNLEILKSIGILDREGRVYRFHLAGEGRDEIDPKQFDAMKVAVTFPGKVLSHNGSSTVQDKTVVWTDPKDLVTPAGLEASGEVANMPLLPWLIAALATLLAAAVFVLLTGRRDRRAYARAAAYAPAPRWGEPGNRGETPDPAQRDLR